MPVIPEFSPAANVGAPGVEQSMNLMQRAAQSRLTQERLAQELEQERIAFEIKRPVLESQARVQLVSEANDLTAAHIINNSVAEDLQRFPQYVKEWTNSATIEDPKQRLNERRRILGAITPFSAIKSTAPLVKAFQTQYAEDATADKTADVLAGKADVSQATNETKLAIKEKDIAIREAAVKAATEKFQQQQDFARQMEEQKAKHAQELEATKGTNRIANTNAGAAARQGTAKEMSANKINDLALNEAEASTAELRDYNQALALLQDPAVRTGTGAQFINQARKIGAIFGLDAGNAQNIEQLNALLGSTFLEKAKSLKGNFSDRDAQTIQRITPNVGTTTEGNIALLSMLVKKKERDLAIGSLINESRKAGESERGIQQDVFDFINAHPLTGPGGAALQGGTKILSIKRIE